MVSKVKYRYYFETDVYLLYYKKYDNIFEKFTTKENRICLWITNFISKQYLSFKLKHTVSEQFL